MHSWKYWSCAIAHKRQGLLVIMLLGWYLCWHQGYHLKRDDSFGGKFIPYWVHFATCYFYIYSFLSSSYLKFQPLPISNVYHFIFLFPSLFFFSLALITNTLIYFISFVYYLSPLKLSAIRTYSFVCFIYNCIPYN